MDQNENSPWPSEAVISLRNLRVSYGEREILHGISFDVQRGETLVILGGSGSGKSTLLRTLVGLETPTSGEIWLKGKNIAAISAAEMDAIFFPLSQISPEVGFSKPTSVRRSVLLPDPEPPRITSVSPRCTSKLIPCRISRSP